MYITYTESLENEVDALKRYIAELQAKVQELEGLLAAQKANQE